MAERRGVAGLWERVTGRHRRERARGTPDAATAHDAAQAANVAAGGDGRLPRWLHPRWIARGVASLFRRGRIEREMDDEMRFHLEARADDLRRSLGLTPAEAMRRARVEFGGVEPYKEDCRQAFGIQVIEDVMRDVGYAARSLRRTPGFTLTAAGAVALGIAVNTALFSIVYGIIQRPLPIVDPDRARNVFIETRGDGHRSSYGTPYFVSYAEFTEMRDRSRTADLAGVAENSVSCKCRPGVPLRVQLASDNLLPLIGAQPALGRFFTREETSTIGGAPVVVLSWTAWRQIFGAAPDIVGRAVMMNRTMFTVIGVADERASGPLLLKPDVWMPLTMQETTRPGNAMINDVTAGWVQLLARLRPGVTHDEAYAELALLGPQAVTRHNPLRTATVTLAPAALMNYPFITQQGGPILALLFVAVSLVLCIGCANVANMLLARGIGRQREIAVRLAIGAGRRRLFQQFLVESIMLGLLGGALGLALSQIAARIVMASLPPVAAAHQIDVSPDWRIVAYTVIVSLLASLAFGGLPALRLLRSDVTPALKADAWQAPARRRRVRLPSLLVAGQAAVTLMLLVDAGLLLRGVDRALHMDRGQRGRDVLIAAFDLPEQRYTAERAEALVTALRERVRDVSSVKAVSTTTQDPLVGIQRTLITPDDESASKAGGLRVSMDEVGVDYFRTMQVAVLRGRAFEAADQRPGAMAVLVDEPLARALGPADGSGDVIGKTLRIGDRRHQIVGVVAATRGLHLAGDDLPRIYRPMQGGGFLVAKLLMHYDGPREPIAAVLRQAMQELDPSVSLLIKPIEQNVTEVMAPARIVAAGITTLGAMALLLGCTGLYGVVAFSVGRRRREIGIRLTLGATHAQVLRLVIGQGLVPVFVGGTIGLLLAAASSMALRSILYGLSPFDPIAFVTMTIGLAGAAALASLIPARAALTVDPSVTLRHE